MRWRGGGGTVISSVLINNEELLFVFICFKMLNKTEGDLIFTYLEIT